MSNLFSNQTNPDIGIPAQTFSNGETYDVTSESADPDPSQVITQADSDNIAKNLVVRRGADFGTCELTIQREDQTQPLPSRGDTFDRDANVDGSDETYVVTNVTPSRARDAFNTYTVSGQRIDTAA